MLPSPRLRNTRHRESTSTSEFAGRSDASVHSNDTALPVEPQTSNEFRLCGAFDLVQEGEPKGVKGPKRPDLIATCASASAETFAIVWRDKFCVYKLSNQPSSSQRSGTQPLTIKRPCVGKLEDSGYFKYGLDLVQTTSQKFQVTPNAELGFGWTAISDKLLVIGVSDSDYWMLFSIGGEELAGPGQCVFKTKYTQRDTVDSVVRRISFNMDATELAVLLAVPSDNSEYLQVFSIAKFPITGGASAVIRDAYVQPDCDLRLDMKYKEASGNIYPYTTRALKFSANGRKIVICTKHISGSALVFVIEKDDENIWRTLGFHRLDIELNHMDDERLGFTSVSL